MYINIKKEKPPVGCVVDVITSDNCRVTDIKHNDKGFYWEFEDDYIEDVEYWMYPPTRPKIL